MASLTPLDQRRAALDGLRAALSAGHPGASPEAFTLAEESVIRSGLGSLDTALGGGFPRGIVATLEGPPGSGRSAVAARLLAAATAGGGLAALVESPNGTEGTLYPPALAAAGVNLERLMVVAANDPAGIARAADILLRAAAFGVVVIPTIALRATAWTRLASLAHRSNALLVAMGARASDELRYFASLRVRLHASTVRFAGSDGLFCALAGIDVDAAILKHKRAAPGKRARFACTTFEREGAPLGALRECVVREKIDRTIAL
jgi:nucleotide-binding universal stress UspA family protein